MAGEAHRQLDLPKFDFPPRLLIVVAPYYDDIASDLVNGARAACERVSAVTDLLEVPGALEIPTAIAMVARSGRYDGFVALGCVIRGETTHYETVCNDSSRGLTLLGLDGHAIGNGILTVETMAQALVRAAPHGQNKGGGAAVAALHLVALQREYARPAPSDAPKAHDPVRFAGRLEGQDRS